MDSVSHEKSSSLETKKKRKIFKCCRNYWKELKARSLNTPSILLLVYATLIPVCRRVLQYITNGFVTPLFNNTECSNLNFENSKVYINLLQYAPFFLIPFCGWLSDTKIGRGNAIYLSLWLGWIGTLLQSISCCLQYNSCCITALIGRYGFSGVAFVLLSVSLAFMFTNILPYGIDQMMNVSSVKIRAFIHWFVWNLFFTFTLSQTTIVLSASFELDFAVIAVIGFTLVSISLCLHFNLRHHFEHIPIPNPYKIVFKVLKYSIKNNHNRRQRSAFTYWGKEPSRIDLAKERYGGSFTHEEVENVKTFLRILAVLATLTHLFMTSTSLISMIEFFSRLFKNSDNGVQTTYTFQLIGYSGCLVLIPLFELVILPLFPKLEYFLMNPLRGLGLANILIILSVLSVFLIDLIGRVTNKSHDIHCFNESITGDPVIQVSYWIFVIPSILSGLSILLVYICTFEFLCSQAPFGMHGMIIGSFWLLYNISNGIGLHIIQYVSISSLSVLSCTSWLTIIFGLVGLVGLVVYVLTARWYVKRIRDTDLDLRTEVEKQWEQRLIKEDSYNNNNNQTDYDTFIISSAEDQT